MEKSVVARSVIWRVAWELAKASSKDRSMTGGGGIQLRSVELAACPAGRLIRGGTVGRCLGGCGGVTVTEISSSLFPATPGLDITKLWLSMFTFKAYLLGKTFFWLCAEKIY